MKVAITGHTEGLGFEIVNLLEYEYFGFSRASGYDINNRQQRKSIIDTIENYDAFINNAHSNFSQVDMLFELYNEWKDKDKLIVNIGSLASIYSNKRYSIQKKALDEACRYIWKQKTNCNVNLIRFGRINTDKILENFPEVKHHIDKKDAAQIVVDSLNFRSKSYFINEILITPI